MLSVLLTVNLKSEQHGWRHINMTTPSEKKKEYNRKYYADNKEKSKESNREWYKANKEKSLAYSRKYYINNREKIKGSSNEWYKANREKSLESSKKWREDNPERKKELDKRWNKDNYDYIREKKECSKEKVKVNSARTRARKKNIIFNITEQDVKDVWPKDNICPALNILLVIGKGSAKDNSPSLDRIDNNKGYTKNNIQIVSTLANHIMSSATPDQVLQVGHYFKELIDSK